MRIIKRTLLIAIFISLMSGCTLKSNDKLHELKPNLNQLTNRANTAIERRGIEVKEVIPYLQGKHSILMDNFKEYDLQVKYENEITVVLVCQDNKAFFEDLSCDLVIDKDYSNENQPCEFHIVEPLCTK